MSEIFMFCLLAGNIPRYVLAIMAINYYDSFIHIAADCVIRSGTVPPRAGSIAAIQYALLATAPYQLTSEDVLFETHRQRNPGTNQTPAQFFERAQACLRASPLVKTYGWGLHHDSAGRVALVGAETPAYRAFAARDDLAQVPGMRNKRAVKS